MTDTDSVVVVDEAEDKMRLDSFLATQFPHLTRAKIQRAILKGSAKVDGAVCKSSYRIATGQQIEFRLPDPVAQTAIAEEIPLDIVFEDDHIIGVNKPPRMVVHPAKGHWSGTLTAALAFHFDQLSSVGGPTRPGIVHRLDRDTSGIIIVAKTDQAHSRLAAQFEARTVEKCYVAVVSPPPDRDRDLIEQPIGPHPYQREKMAIRKDHSASKNASTFYEVAETIGRFALVHVYPKTGRTHQIRVHLSHAGSPVIADKLYGGSSQLTDRDVRGESNETGDAVVLLDRQALHAKSITFQHPETGKAMTLQANLAADIESAWRFIGGFGGN